MNDPFTYHVGPHNTIFMRSWQRIIVPNKLLQKATYSCRKRIYPSEERPYTQIDINHEGYSLSLVVIADIIAVKTAIFKRAIQRSSFKY